MTSATLLDFSCSHLQETQELLTHEPQQWLLNELWELYNTYAQADADQQQDVLLGEWRQLNQCSPLPSQHALALADTWAGEQYGTYLASTARHGRNLLHYCYCHFEQSPFVAQLAERSSLSKTALFEKADDQLLRDWFLLWLLHTYPATAQLLFSRTTLLPYSPLQCFPLDQLLYYLPLFVWWQLGNCLRVKQQQRLVAELATGQNVRTTNATPLPFSRRMAHYFHNAPQGLSFEQTLWYSIVYGNGGNAWLLRLLPQYFAEQQYNLPLLRLLIPFFKPLEKQLETHELPHLCGYFQHLWDEQGTLTIKGWTLKSLRRRAQQWYEQLALQQQHTSQLASKWLGANYRPYTSEQQGSRYEIVQLNSIKKLQQEGRQMMHCVGSYAPKCQLQGCSIWSLRQTKGERTRSLVTIEVNRQHEIVQTRKMFNATPDQYDRTMIKTWADAEGLKY